MKTGAERVNLQLTHAPTDNDVHCQEECYIPAAIGIVQTQSADSISIPFPNQRAMRCIQNMAVCAIRYDQALLAFAHHVDCERACEHQHQNSEFENTDLLLIQFTFSEEGV